MISYIKMSKRQKKAENAKKRNVWPISPITRIVPSKKGAYNRTEFKKGERNYDF